MFITVMEVTETGQEDLPLRPFGQSLPMALLRARESAMRLFRPMLAAHDLTEQQWRVLRALVAADDAIDASELASRTFLLAPSLSRILANLVERGLIERDQHPEDQRRVMLQLSDEGRRLVAQVAPESEDCYDRIEQRFGQQRLQDLLHELHELAVLSDLGTTYSDEVA